MVDPSKVTYLKKQKNLTNVGEVRSFLCLVNYYQKFVKGFSRIVFPLTELTKKDMKFEQTQKCKRSF